MSAPETLETPRLTGRRVQDDDLPYIFDVDQDPRVQRTLFGAVQTEAQSRERHRRWIRMWEVDGFGFWVFADRSGAAIGHGGLFASAREVGEIEMGYVIKPAHWGRGFATEIAQASLHVGFGAMQLGRIIAIAQTANASSRRVMEKCGLAFETEKRFLDGSSGVRYGIGAAAYARLVSG